jgi:hypothetical protein
VEKLMMVISVDNVEQKSLMMGNGFVLIAEKKMTATFVVNAEQKNLYK